MNHFVPSSTTIELSSTDVLQRVMIVDDHEIFRNGLRDLINIIEGFQVVAEAGSCENMLSLVEQMHIDLIILDMYLPDGDGIQAIRQVKCQGMHAPRVIILSAVMYRDTLVDSILAGAEGYLTKDMPAVDIVKSLKGFQRGELALSRKVTTKLVQLLVQRFAEKETEVFSSLQNDHISTPSLSLSPPVQLNTVASSRSTFIPTLTPQEDKVFQLLRHGLSNKQIATRLSISPYTVGKHVQNILHKLGVTNRTQAVSYTSFEGGIYPK